MSDNTSGVWRADASTTKRWMPSAGAAQSQMTMHGCVRASESHDSSSRERYTGVKPHAATKSPTMSVNSALEDATRIRPRVIAVAAM